ncbi:hypothetical protein ABGB17_02670 [Sphaerisporangium sp. B11E5]|uniref:hypothetical protein n=1 Tax=Sphaerisporangium sp. B11E5 TaxID=3153563 RepID=UPI00325EFFE5
MTDEERAEFVTRYGAYGKPHFPFSVCTVSAQRRSLSDTRPWIVCPKRMLDLRPEGTGVPPELRDLMPDIHPGQNVRIWWEVKFTHKDANSPGNFEYTFDFLLAPVEQTGAKIRFAGPPYAIEVMTSSTRGGGLTEHLWDVLLGRPQRPLSGVVDSPYTPNYRQVFGRMLSQFFVKCETLAAWGGRTVWLIQDELLSYIEESTDFERSRFRGSSGAGTLVVYDMADESSHYELRYLETVQGPTRPQRNTMDVSYMTDMVGAGYIPPISALEEMLLIRPRSKAASNWREIIW